MDLFSDAMSSSYLSKVWGGRATDDVGSYEDRWSLVGAVNLKARGAKGDGTVGDRAIIQTVVNEVAAAGGGIIYAPKPSVSYLIDTQPIDWPSNVTLVGDIRESGVKFSRNGAFEMFNIIGPSVLSGNSSPHKRRSRFERIELDGANQAADMFVVKAASLLDFRDVRFGSSMQSLFKCYEMMDSRFWNCRFTHADDPTGTYYAVDFDSGSDGTTTWEYTNQIHFYSCVFEDNIGRMFRAWHQRTNEIYFTNCKIEGLACSLSDQMLFSSVDDIYFNNLQVTTKGSTGNLAAQILSFVNCSNIRGNITFEHQGDVAAHANVDPLRSVSPTAMSITNFAKFDACFPVNLEIQFRGYSLDKLQGTAGVSVVNTSLQNDIQVRWYSNTMKKTGVTSGIQNMSLEMLTLAAQGAGTFLRMRSYMAGLTATGIWDWRIANDGGGNPRNKIIHNNGTDELSVMEFAQERDVYMAAGMKEQVVNSVAAAGTTLAAATLLSYTAIHHIVRTATAGSAEAVKLPAAGTHKKVWVKNQSGATIKVFPNVSGGTIDGGSAGASVDIPTGKGRYFVTYSSNNWESFLSA